MSKTPIALAAVCSVVIAVSASPLAAQAIEPETQSFYENYLDAPPPATRSVIVGATIAGVRSTAPTRPFDPEHLRITVGAQTARTQPVCVKLLSRDGRYFARARFKIDGGSSRDVELKLGSKFAKQLGVYSTADVAIAAGGCDEKKPEFYVAGAAADQPQSGVIVQLRAGDARVRAQLGFDNKAVGPPVLCAPPPSGPTVGFSAECVLPIPSDAKPGRYQLSVGETATSGEVAVKIYSLVLDPHPMR